MSGKLEAVFVWWQENPKRWWKKGPRHFWAYGLLTEDGEIRVARVPIKHHHKKGGTSIHEIAKAMADAGHLWDVADWWQMERGHWIGVKGKGLRSATGGPRLTGAQYAAIHTALDIVAKQGVDP